MLEDYLKKLFSLDCTPAEAKQMLRLRSRFTDIADFDLVSGEALPTDMVRYLNRTGCSVTEEVHDRLYRISDYVAVAFRVISEQLREQIVREHTVMPIHAARELDKTSLIWISRKPGRNIREKLGGKPAIMAVKRRHSIDTLENRLLKAFVKRLSGYLEKRSAFIDDDPKCTDLLRLLKRWLRDESLDEIGDWRNIPPNNTLLHHKQYRKIWNAWGWLRRIDENLAEDQRRLDNARVSAVFWNILVLLAQSEAHRIVQQPLALDYDDLVVKPTIAVRGYDSVRTTAWTAESKNGLIRFIFQSQKNLNIAVRAAECLINGKPYPFDAAKSNALEQLAANIARDFFPASTPVPTADAPDTDESDADVSAVEQSAEYVAVDLYSVRPQYVTDTGRVKRIPFRLIRQQWGDSGDCDCGRADAIMLAHPDVPIQTFSMLDLFDETRSQKRFAVAPLFIEALSNHIPFPRNGMHYLVPDWINDFALESVRKIIRYAYKDAFPMPRSIAAIGAWQASDKFAIQSDALVLVIDTLPGHIAITPLVGTFDPAILNAVPETHGFKWDRHPTFTLSNTDSEEVIKTNLTNAGCPFAEDLLRIFGFSGLVNGAGKLSFADCEQKDGADRWFHVPTDIRKILLNKQPALGMKDIQKELKALKIGDKELPVFLLPLQKIFKPSALPPNWQSIAIASRLLNGAHSVIEWQQRLATADETLFFWRDHLPELSIEALREGKLDRFYLVKDATMAPLRGKETAIHIGETFTLPPGASFYRFPLFQGEGKTALQFSAYLQSPAFPLIRETECKLHMTYAYGEDMPYKLRFIPIDQKTAGFKSVPVVWKPLDADGVPVDLSAPQFPERENWKLFSRYPKRNGNGTHDLFDWCVEALQTLEDLKNRKTGYFKWGKTDKNGNYYCHVQVPGEATDVFCHSKYFIETLPSCYENMPCYLEIRSEIDGRLQGRNISFSQIVPESLIEQIEKLISKIRFPVLTIWKDHSLSEPEAPQDFRNAVFKAQQTIITLLQRDDIPDSLKQELFHVLCCMHKDAPRDVLLDRFKAAFDEHDAKALRREAQRIGYAIGDAGLEWQADLFNRTLALLDHNAYTAVAFEILAIALWRSERLVYALDIHILQSIVPQLQNLLAKDCKDIEKGSDKRVFRRTTLRLELLLALLRTRASGDENLKRFFTPRKEPSVKLIAMLNTLNELDLSWLKSRLIFPDIQKPEGFSQTPDLIYALRLYLTGDSGAHQISIKVHDEE
ncbi:MAG: DUF2357 domain-containing protein [Spirochaetaceae bacterium]|jgi:hypothetical protein|nr:DUF2357 domain-containing protein [Spirochaetaceae bacterium]